MQETVLAPGGSGRRQGGWLGPGACSPDGCTQDAAGIKEVEAIGSPFQCAQQLGLTGGIPWDREPWLCGQHAGSPCEGFGTDTPARPARLAHALARVWDFGTDARPARVPRALAPSGTSDGRPPRPPRPLRARPRQRRAWRPPMGGQGNPREVPLLSLDQRTAPDPGWPSRDFPALHCLKRGLGERVDGHVLAEEPLQHGAQKEDADALEGSFVAGERDSRATAEGGRSRKGNRLVTDWDVTERRPSIWRRITASAESP